MGRACAKCGDDLVMGLLDYLPCGCEVSATPALDRVLESARQAECAKRGRRIRRLRPFQGSEWRREWNR